MKKAIGLIELKSIPIGIQTADEMLKAANVELILANPICPGKYMILISGDVGAVNNSIKTGINMADIFLVESHVINNVHEDVLVAVSGVSDVKDIKSIGAIETISALTAIKAADIAVKSSNIKLIEVRIAKGLGGKGFLIMTGEVSSIKSAVKSCENELGKMGEITSTAVIPSPHRNLIESLV
ncbi:BMC domain-containing protein [Terrisporobacter vanillatitrophus]|uniref:BMC domain-containing protein n=1 Tax=Terrisporobacter vanillatitrophus TaxID=3058402 RepID=UPI00336619A1